MNNPELRFRSVSRVFFRVFGGIDTTFSAISESLIYPGNQIVNAQSRRCAT